MGEEKSSWGLFVVLLILFAVFFGGGVFGGNGRNAIAAEVVSNSSGCNRVSNCEVERQEIIDTYNTQLNTINQAQLTRTEMAVGFKALADQSSLQYNAEQAYKLNRAEQKVSQLENMLYSNGKFDAIERQLEHINCRMLPRPEIFGIGATCSGQIIPPIAAAATSGGKGIA